MDFQVTVLEFYSVCNCQLRENKQLTTNDGLFSGGGEGVNQGGIWIDLKKGLKTVSRLVLLTTKGSCFKNCREFKILM